MKKLLSIALLGAAANFAQAADVTIPNTFTAGTAAKAAEVNENFTALATAHNSTLTVIDDSQSLGRLIESFGHSSSITVLNSNNYQMMISMDSQTGALKVGDLSIGYSYASNDCSGQAYTSGPIFGVGKIGMMGSNLMYINKNATPTTVTIASSSFGFPGVQCSASSTPESRSVFIPEAHDSNATGFSGTFGTNVRIVQ